MSLYRALADACLDDLGTFARKAFPILEPGRAYTDTWHVDCVCDHLQALYDGDIKRLIINIPPRTLKSVLVAQIFPAWCLAKAAHIQFIGVSYAHTLAERNVMGARKILTSDFYLDSYPHVKLSSDNNRKDFFTTDANGQYKGTGIGGTVTGFGADILLIDDPINPKEAMSDTIRATASEEIRATLFSRFNDYEAGKLVMIMQRVHEADPSGELLALGGYHHLKLPAEAVAPVKVFLGKKTWGMKQGELLTPRLPIEALEELKLSLGEYNYSGQYLQDPVPMGGRELRPEWRQIYQNGGISPKNMNVVILCDPAGGEDNKRKKLSDWTVFMVVGLSTDNNYYILDMVRDRLNPTERIDTLFILHRKWNALCGKPPKVGYERYGMQSDIHYINDKKRTDAYNFSLIELGGAMHKNDRIRRMIPDMQMGRWYFPVTQPYVDGEGRMFDLIKEFDSEMLSFPRSRFDDMLDCVSRVYDDNLFMVFPAQKKTMVQRAISDNYSGGDDWRDF